MQESAKPYYNLLIEAGIIHFTAESLYKKVNSIYEDVDFWWNQNSIQDARSKFCNNYARKSKSPIKDLKLIIRPKKII